MEVGMGGGWEGQAPARSLSAQHAIASQHASQNLPAYLPACRVCLRQIRRGPGLSGPFMCQIGSWCAMLVCLLRPSPPLSGDKPRRSHLLLAFQLLVCMHCSVTMKLRK